MREPARCHVLGAQCPQASNVPSVITTFPPFMRCRTGPLNVSCHDCGNIYIGIYEWFQICRSKFDQDGSWAELLQRHWLRCRSWQDTADGLYHLYSSRFAESKVGLSQIEELWQTWKCSNDCSNYWWNVWIFVVFVNSSDVHASSYIQSTRPRWFASKCRWPKTDWRGSSSFRNWPSETGCVARKHIDLHVFVYTRKHFVPRNQTARNAFDCRLISIRTSGYSCWYHINAYNDQACVDVAYIRRAVRERLLVEQFFMCNWHRPWLRDLCLRWGNKTLGS